MYSHISAGAALAKDHGADGLEQDLGDLFWAVLLFRDIKLCEE